MLLKIKTTKGYMRPKVKARPCFCCTETVTCAFWTYFCYKFQVVICLVFHLKLKKFSHSNQSNPIYKKVSAFICFGLAPCPEFAWLFSDVVTWDPQYPFYLPLSPLELFLVLGAFEGTSCCLLNTPQHCSHCPLPRIPRGGRSFAAALPPVFSMGCLFLHQSQSGDQSKWHQEPPKYAEQKKPGTKDHIASCHIRDMCRTGKPIGREAFWRLQEAAVEWAATAQWIWGFHVG